MRILLLDNAIDSFEWALRHLRTFLEIDCHFETPDISTTYLKQAIISLNTSLELFFKAKISDINPLLIYEHISTDDVPNIILDYYTKVQNKELEKPLYNYMIEYSDIHTIEYSKCIELYCQLYSVPIGHKEDFLALNGVRNKLIHLGISSQEEYYVLAGRIANTLTFIQYDILKTLEYDQDHISNICCDLLDIEFTLATLESNIWFTINYSNIELICKKLKTVFQSKEITDYLQEKNVVATFGITLDMPFSYACFTMNKDGIEHEIANLYAIPSQNALFLSDSEYKDGPVYAVFIPPKEISLPEKFYKSTDDSGIEIPTFEEQGNFWCKKPYSSSFANVPFGNKQLTEVIKQIINYMSTVEFVPLKM